MVILLSSRPGHQLAEYGEIMPPNHRKITDLDQVLPMARKRIDPVDDATEIELKECKDRVGGAVNPTRVSQPRR